MNLGTGRKILVKDVIKLIKKELGLKNIKIKIKKSYAEDTWGTYANISKLKSEGWTPKFNLAKGAKLTIYEETKKK